ncbi:hypothetical protein ACFL4X_02505, partial [Gemmatimonadota bacterium]
TAQSNPPCGKDLKRKFPLKKGGAHDEIGTGVVPCLGYETVSSQIEIFADKLRIQSACWLVLNLEFPQYW